MARTKQTARRQRPMNDPMGVEMRDIITREIEDARDRFNARTLALTKEEMEAPRIVFEYDLRRGVDSGYQVITTTDDEITLLLTAEINHATRICLVKAVVPHQYSEHEVMFH